MLDGSGLAITVLLAVTHVAVTVCSLLLHQAEVRVTVIVLIVGIDKLTAPVCPFTLNTAHTALQAVQL